MTGASDFTPRTQEAKQRAFRRFARSFGARVVALRDKRLRSPSSDERFWSQPSAPRTAHARHTSAARAARTKRPLLGFSCSWGELWNTWEPEHARTRERDRLRERCPVIVDALVIVLASRGRERSGNARALQSVVAARTDGSSSAQTGRAAQRYQRGNPSSRQRTMPPARFAHAVFPAARRISVPIAERVPV